MDKDPPPDRLQIDRGVGESDVTSLHHVDPTGVDWPRVGRTAYLLHQRFAYEYSRPITHLRLVVTPPASHGDQRLHLRRIRVSPADGVARCESVDEFGNAVVDIRAQRVQKSITFETWCVVERQGCGGPFRESATGLLTFLAPTPLTKPNRALRSVAQTLMASGDTGVALAARINDWVFGHMTYQYGVTGVRTDAATAMRLAVGVCQDYAHIMLTLSRLCGIPARYVSGHLLGEGGTHAWVEVLVPDAADASQVMVHAFDPTHGRIAGLKYLTVAVGRDYCDVAPTSGSYRAGGHGSLESKKRVELVRVDYAA
jgi:transglutaminase-like putative cysteine protease